MGLKLQNLVADNWGLQTVGNTGYNNRVLYQIAMEGGDPLVAMGLKDGLMNLKFSEYKVGGPMNDDLCEQGCPPLLINLTGNPSTANLATTAVPLLI